MKRARRCALLLAMVAGSAGIAAPNTNPAGDLMPLQFLRGKWVCEGTSELGHGSGWFTFEPDLRGRAMIRRNHSEYPAKNGRSAYVHEHVMVVYADPVAHATRAFYYDTEGHVIHYVVTVTSGGHRATFLSLPAPGAPQFRLTYMESTPGRLSLTLSKADADSFRMIVAGKVRRVR